MAYSVRAVASTNRLYVELAGFLDDAGAEEACAAIIAEAEKLSAGFDIVTDISSFRATTEKGADAIAALQRHLGEMGVRRVVRVVGDSVLPNMQLSRTAREAGYGPGVHPDTVHSLEEAEELLAQSPGGRPADV